MTLTPTTCVQYYVSPKYAGGTGKSPAFFYRICFKVILPNEVCAHFGVTVPGRQWVNVLISTGLSSECSDSTVTWALTSLQPSKLQEKQSSRERVLSSYQPDLVLPPFLLLLT